MSKRNTNGIVATAGRLLPSIFENGENICINITNPSKQLEVKDNAEIFQTVPLFLGHLATTKQKNQGLLIRVSNSLWQMGVGESDLRIILAHNYTKKFSISPNAHPADINRTLSHWTTCSFTPTADHMGRLCAYDGAAAIIQRTFDEDFVETVTLSTDWTDATASDCLGRVELCDGSSKNLAGIIIDVSSSSEAVITYYDGHIHHHFNKPVDENMVRVAYGGDALADVCLIQGSCASDEDIENLNPEAWIDASYTDAENNEDPVTSVTDRANMTYAVVGSLALTTNWENGLPAIDLDGIIFESNTEISDAGDSVVCMVVETPDTWSGFHVLFNGSAKRYLLYNDGELKNFSSWDSGLSLDTSSTYLITHYFDGETEYFRVLKKGGSVQTASAAHTYVDDETANWWWGSGNTSSPTPAHQWRGKLGLALYYPGTDYTTAEDYAKLKFGFDTPAVSIEPGRIIKRAAIADDNAEKGYMGMETAGTESYNRKRIGRYIGPSVTDLNSSTLFTTRTFTVGGTDYKIAKLPLHLTI